MAVEGFALQAGSYGAEVLRRATLGVLLERGSSIGSVEGGLVGATDLATTAGTGMNLETAPGEVIVDQAYSTSGGPNYIRVTSTLTTKVPAANATNPRIDCLCAQILDEAYHGSSNEYAITYLEGTPTSGATLANRASHGEPALPTSAMALDYILVPAKATSLENADIEKVAKRAVLGLPLGAETVLAAMLKAGAVTGPKLGEGTVRQETGSTQSFLSWGLIQGATELKTGSGDYTFKHISTGHYELVWDVEKASETYGLLIAPETSNGSHPISWGWEARTKSHMTFSTYSLEGTETKHFLDCPFMFIVMGTS
ncbi:MAG TPA: hypothetical protein VGF95_14460 [Solirubrobacteraceae bacterium]|jgi:hypothetical protein